MSRKMQKIYQFINYKITDLLISLFLLVPTLAQNLPQMESDFKKLDQLYQREQIRLDSLTAQLKNKAKKINQEKNKKEIDKDNITDLMAKTITLTNKIRTRQDLVTNIEKKIEETKKILDAKYESIIDSLNNLKLAQQSPEVDALILEFTQKRLLVSPRIYSLSLDPQKILQIDISASEDSIEKAIYEEYLINALSEVDSQLIQLKNSKEEIQQIVYLQQKANDFIDDIDTDFPASSFAQKENKAIKNVVTFGGDPEISFDQSSRISTKAHSYGYLLSQLKRFPNSDIQSTWQTPLDSIPANLTFQQYDQLLMEVEKRLEEYRFVLRYKLDNFK